jgi:hypothetical protein
MRCPRFGGASTEGLRRLAERFAYRNTQEVLLLNSVVRYLDGGSESPKMESTGDNTRGKAFCLIRTVAKPCQNSLRWSCWG